MDDARGTRRKPSFSGRGTVSEFTSETSGGQSPPKYVVAVSGGVDSIVLLDMLMYYWETVAKGMKALPELQGVERSLELISKDLAEGQAPPFIITHFDHGIRPESSADARFVEALAKKYALAFETKREELGENASEELARQRRYAFLHEVAARHKARIVTAHHADDVVETIAINLQRGTGWRGLAVLDNEYIERPLLTKTKQELYEYALSRRLEWVEDETNASDAYLRNRTRRVLHGAVSSAEKARLLTLWQKQLQQKAAIDKETTRLLKNQAGSRYFFTHIDEVTALELLRANLLLHEVSLTRPARKRLLHAIKTMQPGSTFEAGGGVKIEFTQRNFIVKLP